MTTSKTHSRSDGGAAQLRVPYPVVLVAASIAVVVITAVVVSLSATRADAEPGAAAPAKRAVGRHAVTWRKQTAAGAEVVSESAR